MPRLAPYIVRVAWTFLHNIEGRKKLSSTLRSDEQVKYQLKSNLASDRPKKTIFGALTFSKDRQRAYSTATSGNDTSNTQPQGGITAKVTGSEVGETGVGRTMWSTKYGVGLEKGKKKI